MMSGASSNNGTNVVHIYFLHYLGNRPAVFNSQFDYEDFTDEWGEGVAHRSFSQLNKIIGK